MGPSRFTSHPKEGALRIFIAYENPSPRPGSNTRPSSPVASTLTTAPPGYRYTNLLGEMGYKAVGILSGCLWCSISVTHNALKSYLLLGFYSENESLYTVGIKSNVVPLHAMMAFGGEEV
jgi:hypothetical protein